MDVVIKLPQELFARNYNGWCDKQDIAEILEAVANGTPLNATNPDCPIKEKEK